MPSLIKKHGAFLWAVVATVGWLLQFLFGSGAYWESKKVTLEISRSLVEFHQKKTAALKEVVAAPHDSPLWKAKMDYLNAIEKNIAHLEDRPPVVYDRPKPVTIRLQ